MPDATPPTEARQQRPASERQAVILTRLQRVKTLPKSLQDYLWSGQVEKAFQSVVSKQQIQGEQLRATTSRLVGQVLIGELHPNSFISSLAEKGSVPIEKARNIARAVSAQVFSPVRNDLMRVYQITGQGGGAPMATEKPQEPKIPAIPQQKPPPAQPPVSPSPPPVSPTQQTKSDLKKPTSIQQPTLIVRTPLESQRAGVPHATPKELAEAAAAKLQQVGQTSSPHPEKPEVLRPTQAFSPAQAEKRTGPVLAPRELLAAEEVVGDVKPKKEFLGIFKKQKGGKKPTVPPPPPEAAAQTPPLPPSPPSPANPLSSNTVNLRQDKDV